MKKGIQMILMPTLVLMLANCNNSSSSDIRKETITAVAKPTATPVDLATLMNAFGDYNNRFKANQEYVGQVLKIKGRTSGVSEDGALRLQVTPGASCVWCYGLPNDFLLTVNKNDIVEITGTFEREDASQMFPKSMLQNCFEYSKITK